MKERKIFVNIISIPNCPACDTLKTTVEDLKAGNQFLKENIVTVGHVSPYKPEHKEFPIFQIWDDGSNTLLYEVVGNYSRATIMWKLIKWIVPNGE